MPFQITVPVGPAAPMTARNALAEWLSARATIVDALAARWGVERDRGTLVLVELATANPTG